MKNLTIPLLICIVLTACANGGNAPSIPAPKVEPDPVMSATPTPPQTGYTPAIEPAECPFSLPQGLGEGQELECGYLVVPEDRTKPEGRLIKLAYAIFHSPNPAARPVPLVYLEGGPGVSALKPLQYNFGRFSSFLQQSDLIFFDQRGVGLSQPALDCPEHQDFIDRSLEKILTAEEITTQASQAFLACRSRFLEEGIDLNRYNTEQSAADLADLQTALAIPAWDLYSVSYGTRLALEMMRSHPEGIRSVILDSVVPPQVDQISEAITNVDAALQDFLETCLQDPSCQQAYPELEILLFELVAALNANPVQVPVANLLTGKQYNAFLDGNTFLGVVIKSLYSAEILPMIPMMVYETAQGNFSKVSSLRSNILTNAAFLSSGMYYTVLCHEEAPFSNADEVAANLAQYPELAGFFESSLANSPGTFAFCEQWAAGQAAAVQSQAVESSIPTLVLAGQFDPSTPPAWSRLAADSLENSYYFEFPGIGHTPSLSHPCPNSIAAAFLADPTQPPEASCSMAMQLSFLLPQDLDNLSFVPAEVTEHHIQTIAPQGWIAVKPEYYVSPDQKVELVFSKNETETQQDFLMSWGAGEMLEAATINGLSWEIYPIRQPDFNVAGYLAVSPNGESFYFVLIVGAQDLQETLYQNVFTPVLQAFSLSTVMAP